MKFSVITPSYNQAKYLSQTIESVISQKGDFDIEYFIFDGGSTDTTVQILKDTEEKLKNNPRIEFYWQSCKDHGQADAINKGLKAATGDIVSYINSDDYYLPQAFSKINQFIIENPNKEWIVGYCDINKKRLKWTFFLKHIWPIQYFKVFLYIFNTINQPSVFLKNSLIKRVGLFDHKYKYAFDYDYWLRCINESLPAVLPIKLAMFRIHNESKGNTGYKKQFSEDMEIVRKFTDSKLILNIHGFAEKIVNFLYCFLK